MTVANESSTGDIGMTQEMAVLARPKDVPLWQRPAFYRYGFLAFTIGMWELFGPLINPILFSYPSKIAIAAYELTYVTGELPYYAMQSMLILVYGLGFAILVGIPLAVLMARVRPVDWALDLPINALYATPRNISRITGTSVLSVSKIWA